MSTPSHVSNFLISTFPLGNVASSADVSQLRAAIKRGTEKGIFTSAPGHSGSLKLAKKAPAAEKKPAAVCPHSDVVF